MTSNFFPSLRTTVAMATCTACLFIAGCGGGGGGGGAGPLPSAMFLGALPAAAGDGAASAEVPIVAAPTLGNNTASGTDAQQPPALNSKLDCAP
ncbi:hypothetical protein CLU95_0867 [Variovorax sp. 54]|uniref:hypothetical protein n=1 Tax=Variovorax sp. 54 TaxID=2035212 RepID=UPI000C19CB43|nr:hypothetical protein [Variovorax sp. 54]PIF73762.1 hypothetical protein CLU95_0867 [Variovorax sp. 54]